MTRLWKTNVATPQKLLYSRCQLSSSLTRSDFSLTRSDSCSTNSAEDSPHVPHSLQAHRLAGDFSHPSLVPPPPHDTSCCGTLLLCPTTQLEACRSSRHQHHRRRSPPGARKGRFSKWAQHNCCDTLFLLHTLPVGCLTAADLPFMKQSHCTPNLRPPQPILEVTVVGAKA